MEKSNIIISKISLAKLSNHLGESCRIIHVKSGLFFNGYDEFYNSSKGKNTLSKTNFKSYMTFNKSDIEILEKAFDTNIKVKSDGKKYIKNEIVFAGSDIHKILSNHYNDYKYLPLEDFLVERYNKNTTKN